MGMYTTDEADAQSIYGLDIGTIKNRLHDAALSCNDINGLYPAIMATTSSYYRNNSSSTAFNAEVFLYDKYIDSCFEKKDKKEKDWSNERLEYITGLKILKMSKLYPGILHYTGLTMSQADFLIRNRAYADCLTVDALSMFTVVMSNESHCTMSEAYTFAKEIVIDKHACCYWRDALAFLQENKIQWMLDVMSGKNRWADQLIVCPGNNAAMAAAYKNCEYDAVIPENIWNHYVKDFIHKLTQVLKFHYDYRRNRISYAPNEVDLDAMYSLSNPKQAYSDEEITFIHRIYDFNKMITSRTKDMNIGQYIDASVLKDSLAKLRPGASKLPMVIIAEDFIYAYES